MSDQDGDGEPDEAPEQWPPDPDDHATDPATMPVHPLRAQDVTALIQKEIG